MFFNTIDFLYFMAVVYPLYLVLNHRWQNRMLLVASYVFYGYWDWRFLSLLWMSTLLDYVVAIRIHGTANPRTRKILVGVSMLGNLGILGVFKYFNFFADSFAQLLGLVGMEADFFTLNVILPIGISFYTFQTLSYTLDVYRGTSKPTRNLLNFALFVSFFPQLVAGPIERARRLLPQIERPRVLNPQQVKEGLFLICWGLFKKIIIADNLGNIVNLTFAEYGQANFWDIYFAVSAFGWQIYGDFSGYSDIARGLAKLMGMELMVNFRVPLFAVRPSDFWRRWHISLTTWVRDYVFVSLGANRRGLWRGSFNLLVAMTLVGFWHGANWTFVLWGFYFGVLQLANVALQPVLSRLATPKTDTGRNVKKWISRFIMYHFAIFSFVLFRAENINHTWGLLRAAVSGFVFTAVHFETGLIFLCFILPVFLMFCVQDRSSDLLIFVKMRPKLQFLWVLIGLAMIAYVHLFGANLRGGEEFIYFQF